MLHVELAPPIARLILNRPEQLNFLGEPGDAQAFEAAFASILAEDSVRCVILTGAGRAFSAGGNLNSMRAKTGVFEGDPARIRENYRAEIHKMLRAIEHFDLPLIAAINGPAVGLGLGVACLCDIRIAAANASFGASFLRIGLIPGDGGAWHLPRLIGPARAAELIFTAATIDAATALDWGLVSRVAPQETLPAEAEALAQQVAQQPRAALRAAKMLLRQSRNKSFDDVLELAAATQALMHATEDHEARINKPKG